MNDIVDIGGKGGEELREELERGKKWIHLLIVVDAKRLHPNQEIHIKVLLSQFVRCIGRCGGSEGDH